MHRQTTDPPCPPPPAPLHCHTPSLTFSTGWRVDSALRASTTRPSRRTSASRPEVGEWATLCTLPDSRGWAAPATSSAWPSEARGGVDSSNAATDWQLLLARDGGARRESLLLADMPLLGSKRSTLPRAWWGVGRAGSG